MITLKSSYKLPTLYRLVFYHSDKPLRFYFLTTKDFWMLSSVHLQAWASEVEGNNFQDWASTCLGSYQLLHVFSCTRNSNWDRTKTILNKLLMYFICSTLFCRKMYDTKLKGSNSWSRFYLLPHGNENSDKKFMVFYFFNHLSFKIQLNRLSPAYILFCMIVLQSNFT